MSLGSRDRLRLCGELCRLVQAAVEHRTHATVRKITFSLGITVRIIVKAEPCGEVRFGVQPVRWRFFVGKELIDRFLSSRVGRDEPQCRMPRRKVGLSQMVSLSRVDLLNQEVQAADDQPPEHKAQADPKEKRLMYRPSIFVCSYLLPNALLSVEPVR